MRRLFSITITILCTAWASIWLVQSSSPAPLCDAPLTLDFVDDDTVQQTRVDLRTGIIWTETPVKPSEILISPDGNYQISSDNQGNVILENRATGIQETIYQGDSIRNLLWTPESDAILIWDDGEQASQSTLTSVDIRTRATRFTHNILANMRWAAHNRTAVHYLYTQASLVGRRNTYAVQFLDTRTGNMTIFQNPTQFPYVWSDNGRWLASRHRTSISIIDPATGDYHPAFDDSLEGVDFQWQGDEAIWINRLTSDMSFSVHKASLADGSITPLLEDARLVSVTPDGTWAVIENFQHEQRYALVEIATGTRYSLPSDESFVIANVAFTTDNHCTAILLRQREQYPLVIFDTSTQNIIHQQYLTSPFTRAHWNK